MLRKTLTVTTLVASLIFSVLPDVAAQTFADEMCTHALPTMIQRLRAFLLHRVQFDLDGTRRFDRRWPAPGGELPRLTPLPDYRTVPSECKETESRLGYPGYLHCSLHPQYQIVFPSAGCNCYTGQCRPTDWREAPRTLENPEGVEIYISGEWFAVKPGVLRKFYEKDNRRSMPRPLLEYRAHVCSSQPTAAIKPNIECAWIRLGSD